MNTVAKFIEWCLNYKIQIEEQHENLFKINNKWHIVIHHEEKVFDETFNLIFENQEDRDIIDSMEIDGLVAIYEFGGQFYWTEKLVDIELKLFKYIGAAEKQLDLDWAFLGIHGEYEILNGSREYKDWCKKAKFLGINKLGICEKNTLAGTLPFQLACFDNKIQPILGETITVTRENPPLLDKVLKNLEIAETTFELKLFAVNYIGWQNLLQINSLLTSQTESKITEERLLELGSGLVCVISSESINNFSPNRITIYKNRFAQLYYQLDSCIFLNQEKDESFLSAQKKYFTEYMGEVMPILLNDAYFLDQKDCGIKKLLNKIGNNGFEFSSENQHFKTIDENFFIFEKLFKDTDADLMFEILEIAIQSTLELAELCQFKIELGKIYLPKYQIEFPYDLQFKTSEEMFLYLIDEGLKNKITSVLICDEEASIENDEIIKQYENRLEYEISVIKKGNLIDYFLILWDIIDWCKKRNILTGIGRGSAGGCLIAYLMDITKIDPIKYELLFERFLNEGRIGKSLPDIDTDFESARRDEVKSYMETKFGQNYVCSVGTYGTLKMKAALKDLGRLSNLSFYERNYVTAILDSDPDQPLTMTDLFRQASEKPVLKNFIQKNAELINNLYLCMNQIKNASIHACATLILPKEKNGEEMNIFNWLPVKRMDGMLVSEWEGTYLEAAGFLKEDILGIQQLDKFKRIFELVKQTNELDLSFDSIDYAEPKVYEMFCQGFARDTFHFGTDGLINYAQELLPTTIDDLIAMISLHRPGVMNTGMHKKYVKRKFGEEEIEYDYMLEEVTRATYGLFCYQEQVMKAVQILGNFTLVEADDVRKAMGKKKRELIDSYKEKFIKGALQNKCKQQDAEDIWHKLEEFATYAFNKSHAAAYAMTGYTCNWLKFKYPVQFWITAFEFAKDENISKFISEIKKTSKIKIKPPHINRSERQFTADFDQQIIYWSLIRVKQLGGIACDVILEERQKNGQFFSLEEFYNRVPKAKVNKRVIINMILAGLFDEIEHIESENDRIALLYNYCELSKNEIDPECESEIASQNWWWIMRQKEISGLGYFDYEQLLRQKDFSEEFIDELSFQKESNQGEHVCIGGIIKEVIERKAAKGLFGQLQIDCNDELIYITYWTKNWKDSGEKIKASLGRIILISGIIKFDDYKKQNVLQTQDKTKMEIL